MNTLTKDDAPPTDASLTALRKEERRWFSWLSVLHECVAKADTPNGVIILDIAKKRWLRAREALRHQGVTEWGTDD
jgi:hypothetical protein